jgi:hypothetical protein
MGFTPEDQQVLAKLVAEMLNVPRGRTRSTKVCVSATTSVLLCFLSLHADINGVTAAQAQIGTIIGMLQKLREANTPEGFDKIMRSMAEGFVDDEGRLFTEDD